MPITPVNLPQLRRIFAAQLARRIPYRLGGKAPTLSAPPAQLAGGIDCSGEVRLLLHQATNGELTIPDGSWNQRAWCETRLEEVPYSQALRADEGELFIAFITANTRGAARVGHVWLVVGRGATHLATTMESYGGHGIGSRPANTPLLLRQVHKCFRLPTTAQLAPEKTPAPPTKIPDLLLNNTPVPGARLENGHYIAPVREVLQALGLDFARDNTTASTNEYRLKVWTRK